jgi:3-phosphoshikimate 1-carboxyvinyltransferase
MTLALLNDLDIKTSFEGNVITVYQNKSSLKVMTVESDWSSASYFFSIVALTKIARYH